MRLVFEKYVLKEVAIPFLISILVMMILMLIQRMILITEWVVNRGVPFIYVLQMLGLTMPFFLTIVTPVALLFATLLAVNRMSADSEVIAMKASGMSIARLFVPVLSLGFICALSTAFLTLYGIPRAAEYSDKLKYEIAKKSARAGVMVKDFVKMGPDMTIYVDAIENDTLKGVLLAKTSSKKKKETGPDNIFVFAKEGTIAADSEMLINYLHLKDGEIQILDKKKKSFREIHFGKFDIKIDLTEEQKQDEVERGTMYELMDLQSLGERENELQKKLKELKAVSPQPQNAKAMVDRYKVAIRQIRLSRHQKFALPVACFILALWGIPLGIQPPRTTRHQGIVTSIALTLIYYVLVSGGKILSVKGFIPAPLALWTPNVIVVLTGILFIYLTANDMPLPLTTTAGRIEEWFRSIVEKHNRKSKK